VKKVFALLIAFLLFLTTLSTFTLRSNAAESDGGSRQPSESYIPKSYAPRRPEQIVTGSATALLIEDVIPWDGDESNYWDANQEALRYLGITYDLVWSNNIPADLSPYKFIMLASTQPTSTYANIQANIARINTYVWNGGIYLAHACDTGWWDLPYGYGSDWTGYSILPNGVTHVGYYYSQNIYIKNLSSPIVYNTNNAYFYNWHYSTHGWFTNVPVGADIVMVTDYNYPTYIIYKYGSGYVFATMQTIEWGYGPFVWYWVGDWRPRFLLNELWYAYVLAQSLPGYGFNGTLPTPPTYLTPPGGGRAPGVGGVVIPVDKFGLLSPFIGLASTIVVATVATTIYVKRVKRRKEKQ
jgi:hypothetical protein